MLDLFLAIGLRCVFLKLPLPLPFPLLARVLGRLFLPSSMFIGGMAPFLLDMLSPPLVLTLRLIVCIASTAALSPDGHIDHPGISQ